MLQHGPGLAVRTLTATNISAGRTNRPHSAFLPTFPRNPKASRCALSIIIQSNPRCRRAPASCAGPHACQTPRPRSRPAPGPRRVAECPLHAPSWPRGQPLHTLSARGRGGGSEQDLGSSSWSSDVSIKCSTTQAGGRVVHARLMMVVVVRQTAWLLRLPNHRTATSGPRQF
jgi:hypothetical protein